MDHRVRQLDAIINGMSMIRFAGNTAPLKIQLWAMLLSQMWERRDELSQGDFEIRIK